MGAGPERNFKDTDNLRRDDAVERDAMGLNDNRPVIDRGMDALSTIQRQREQEQKISPSGFPNANDLIDSGPGHRRR